MPSERPADALTDQLRLDADGLVACICQHAYTGEVLMLAWADAEALRRTVTTRRATFYSRSRQAYWEKGATSGNTLRVVAVRLDCDADAVLLEVVPDGPACHTGSRSCFGQDGGGILGRLRRTINERRDADPGSSYTARMLHAPRSHVARKVGEEAAEVLTDEPASATLVGEVADLWFHSMLLLARDGLDPLAPLAVLAERHRQAEPFDQR
jgi:phosphoribosyl-AMP cyclohydrolase / phosphoribosyl-ATP pyrophosphohydrolase